MYWVTTGQAWLMARITKESHSWSRSATPATKWDGEAAAIVLLTDGRFCAWHSFWGPTGSGFSEDAYGGYTDVGFARTLHAAEGYIKEDMRKLLRWEAV